MSFKGGALWRDLRLGILHIRHLKFSQVVEKVTDQLSYWPRDIKLYSSSGCKRVAQKIDLVVEEMEEEGGNREDL